MHKIRRRSSASLRRVGANLIGAVGSSAVTPATSLTVNDYLSRKIFQRQGTSYPLTVSGTYTGPACVIQARAAPHGTSLTDDSIAWVTVALYPTGGTFSGTLTTPQGGWYVIQVRDGVNNAVRAGGANRFGIGAIIALLGQSNIANMLSAVINYPLGGTKVCNFDGANWDRIGNINDAYPPNTYYGAGGYSTYTADPGAFLGDGFVFMANYMQSALNIPIGTLAYPQGGTRIIQNWYTGQGAWTTFANAATASGGEFEAAIWYQGESDAPYLSTAQYKTALGVLHGQLKTLSGRSNLPMGVVPLGPILDSWATSAQVANIRQAQLEYITETADAFFIATSIDLNLSGSNVHIDNASQSKMGKRYANALINLSAGTVSNAAGPKIATASRSGATITVNIVHNGGTALQDGAGGSGTALLGWRVFDGGVPSTISATAIAGNTVQLTLSAIPSGAVTLDYAMSNAPFAPSTVTPASVVYDNQSIYDIGGLPLQPHALMAVT